VRKLIQIEFTSVNDNRQPEQNEAFHIYKKKGKMKREGGTYVKKRNLQLDIVVRRYVLWSTLLICPQECKNSYVEAGDRIMFRATKARTGHCIEVSVEL
jgi:hypothetical protein